MPVFRALILTLLLAGWHGTACADTATIAVATNFKETMQALATAYQAQSGATLIIVSGSSGKLYAQIGNGAPYDAFLSADRDRPEKLCAAGTADAGSRFTYALGRLSLWSVDANAVRVAAGGVPEVDGLRSLAIANPALAPYGAAAVEALQRLGLWEAVQDRLVMGENVGQAYALVATGNAQAGFVARSALVRGASVPAGSRWDVPDELHAPIRQDAVLLAHGRQNPVARDFLAFLATDAARGIIAAHGYGLD